MEDVWGGKILIMVLGELAPKPKIDIFHQVYLQVGVSHRGKYQPQLAEVFIDGDLPCLLDA